MAFERSFTMAKHLTFDDRLSIERYLVWNYSLSEIAKILGYHKSTLSREICNRSFIDKKGCYGHSYNACIFRFDCDLKNICTDTACKNQLRSCKFCKHCNESCEYFKEDVCEKLNSHPYVCNNCSQKSKCTLTKRYYSAKTAQKNYEKILVESRLGIESSTEEIQRMDNIITPLTNKGQSIHHICSNNRNTIMVSEKTIYKYIGKGILSTKNVDLPRKVRYKPRAKKRMGYKVDKNCLNGRRYSDYKNFLNENKDTAVVQIDTVEGKKGGKVLLTIHFVDTSFMIMLLRDANDSKSVTECFRLIYDSVGSQYFKKLFPVILTDNGSEFSDPENIERINDKKLTNVFYCYPYSAYLKPEIENNHELIRKVIPKGQSMDNLTQRDISILMSNVNSYKRKKLNDQSPFDAFSNRYGFKLINALNIHLIAPNNINLTPDLLK